MTETAEGKVGDQHEEQAPLFLCCSGCQAVSKAGCKTCRVCGLQLKGPVDKVQADSQMNEDANMSDEEDVTSDGSASGSDLEGSSDDQTGNEERAQSGSDAETSGRLVETHRAKIQPREQMDLPLFNCNTDKPMMEMEAGSNVWYQAVILRETANEIRVVFPDPEEGDHVTKEWVKKSSSRIWRGSLSKHAWKYLSKGAWAPKKNPKPRRQRRSGSASKQARRKPQGEATDGTGTGASMDVDSAGEDEQAAHAEGGDGPQPRRKRKREAVAAAPDAAAAATGGEDGGATHSTSGVPDAGGFGFNDGVGLSSKDEAQAPEAEPEPPDPLAAWFRVHYGLLEERGTLVMQLDGAGPEVGVPPHHAPLPPPQRPAKPAEPPRRKHGRNYDVNEGRCTDDADPEKKTEMAMGSDWQPARNGGARVMTGTGVNKSPPFKLFPRQSEDAGHPQPQSWPAAKPVQRPSKGSGSEGAEREGKQGVATPQVAAGSDSEQHRKKQHGGSRGGSRISREVHVRAGNNGTALLTERKWGMDSSSDEDEDRCNSPKQPHPEQSPDPARKHAGKSSTAAARDQKPGKARKQPGKEKHAKAGQGDRTEEQQPGQSGKGGGGMKAPDTGVKLPGSSAAQPKPKPAAQPGAAGAGKPSAEGGQGRPVAPKAAAPSRAAGAQAPAGTHKRSPLGQAPKKASVWHGEPAHMHAQKAAAAPLGAAKPAAKQAAAPAAGAAAHAAAGHTAKKLLVAKEQHRHVGNGPDSNNSSAADVNTAGGPLMLQPSDCFED